MSILLPNIGVTYPYKGQSLLRHAPEQFIGTFLIPGGYGFSEYHPPSEWSGAPLGYSSDPEEKDKSSQYILELIDDGIIGAKDHNSEDKMYLMYWIGMLADPRSPSSVNFCIHHIRTLELRAILGLQIQNDIPTHAEVLDFNFFQESKRPDLPRDLRKWALADWENYCHQD